MLIKTKEQKAKKKKNYRENIHKPENNSSFY